MKTFKVPYDVKREEKIFGGYLSLRQVLYLMLIGISCTLFFIPKTKWISLAIIIILTIFFLLCAFMKDNEQSFDNFFFYVEKNYIFTGGVMNNVNNVYISYFNFHYDSWHFVVCK